MVVLIHRFLSEKIRGEHHHILRCAMQDIFPNVTIDTSNITDADVRAILHKVIIATGAYTSPSHIESTIQLHRVIQMHTGTILVGPPGCGKTTALSTLCQMLNRSESTATEIIPLNPKANPIQIFGGNWKADGEWHDGILQKILKQKRTSRQWLIFDGPLDPSWANNLYSAMDNCRQIAFESGEQIPIDYSVRFVFETDRLDYASPSFVSRCGIVWCQADNSEWMPRVRWWIDGIAAAKLDRYLKEFVMELFEGHLERCISYAQSKFQYVIVHSFSARIIQLCTLFDAQLERWPSTEGNPIDRERAESILLKIFIWSALWSIGGGLQDEAQAEFELFIRTTFDCDPQSR